MWEGDKLTRSLAWHGEENGFVAAEDPHRHTLPQCLLEAPWQADFLWHKQNISG